MNVPRDYQSGYEKARAVEQDRADNYIAHTGIGDPEADTVAEYLAGLERREAASLIRIILGNRDEVEQPDVPSIIRDFIESCETVPDWVEFSAFDAGIRTFHRNARVILAAMIAGALVEGFSTNIAKSFFITGRLRDQGVRRLKQNNRHMVEIFMPGGLERDGDGWKLSMRIRLIHAQIRRLLSASDDWDLEAWGTPISAAHLGFAITAFSARLLKHMQSLGATFDDEGRASFMAVWRYTGYLMGIPETILFRDEADALEIFRVGLMCEPPSDLESIVMAHALVNSAPMVAGLTDSNARQTLVGYVYRVSRALIGNALADVLNYPSTPTFGVLPWFRMQQRYDSLMDKVFTKRKWSNNKMLSLLQVSLFDEGGLGYNLPDHVYAEQSKEW